MTKEEFANKIKTKYPEYKDINTDQLVNRIVDRYPVYESQITDYVKPKTGAMQDIKQAGRGIVESFREGGTKVAESMDAYNRGEQGLASTALQAIGAGAGAVSGAAGEVIKGGVKAVLPQGAQEAVGGAIESVGGAIRQVQPIQNMLARYEQLKLTDPEKARDIEGALGIGQLALDIATAGTGKAATTAARETATNVVGTAAKNVANTTADIATGAAKKGSSVLNFATSKVSGLQPETIRYVLQNPEKYTEAVKQGVTRSGVADDFFNTVQSKLDEVTETGAQYQTIKESGVTVVFDTNPIVDALQKNGFTLKDGRIVSGTKSATRDPGQIRELQQLYDNWGDAKQLDAEEFLNMRRDIGELSKFDSTGAKAQVDEKIGQGIYSELNKSGGQIPGLRELDEQFAPIKKEIESIRKEFLTKDTDGNWTLKDAAINKIANAKGAGKDKLLDRLESYMPGIGEKVRVAKVLEDVEYAKGRTVGAYLQGGVVLGSLASGNIPLLIGGLIVTNPDILLPLLVKTGYAGKKAESLLAKVKAGKALTTSEKEAIKSVRGVSKEDLIDVLGGAGAVVSEQELIDSTINQ